MLTIGRQPFLLVARGDWAWSRGPAQEAAIIAAVRGADSMRVEARDQRRPALHRPLCCSRRADRDRCRRGRCLRSATLAKSAELDYIGGLAMSADTALDADSRHHRSRARQARRAGARRRPASSWSAWSKDAIRAALEAAGLEPRQAKLRAKQIWHWIYNRGVSDFAAMSDIAKAQRAVARRALRHLAARKWSRRRCRPTAPASGCSRTHDGHDYEMVFIPDADRGTLCVSSQVGCTLNCRFCHTGTMTAGAQPRAGGDRRPGDAGARRARRMAEPARRADADQHRDDGHGRAAL